MYFKTREHKICGTPHGPEHSIHAHSKCGLHGMPFSEADTAQHGHTKTRHTQSRQTPGWPSNRRLFGSHHSSYQRQMFPPATLCSEAASQINTHQEKEQCLSSRWPCQHALTLPAVRRPATNCSQCTEKCHDSILSNSPSAEPTL